jgi:uncharacterized protein (TIGR02145 family)
MSTLSTDSYFTDPRDGKKYKTVKIGNQVWMAENLNYVGSFFDRLFSRSGKCYSSAKGYGRLYNWNTAIKVCPSGWHLPTNAEWDILINAVGEEKTAGKHLKAKSGWKNNGNGLDIYGFSALPGGNGFSAMPASDGFPAKPSGSALFGDVGRWWSASECEYGSEYARIDGIGFDKLSMQLSVRCVMD